MRPVDIHMPSEFPEQRVVADVLEDAHGSLWVATPSGLYRRWPDGSAARYTTRDGLPNDYFRTCSKITRDTCGPAPRSRRLLPPQRRRHSPRTSDRAQVRHTNSSDPYGLPTTWVIQLFETSDRRFWVATARGLVEFFPALTGKPLSGLPEKRLE